MSKPKYEHEYLFILGNGASIASADPRIGEFINTRPSIDKFVDVMDEIIQNRRKIGLQRLIGDFILDISYCQCVERILEISKEFGKPGGERESNIQELISILLREQRNDDLKKVFSAVFITIMAFYKNVGDKQNGYSKYFFKLWEIVRKTQSPVVSLNWDINFEKTIYEDTKIDMKNYYGKYAFEYSFPKVSKESYVPIVDILKPHGSLNWHFLDSIGLLNVESGLAISNQISIGPWVEEDLHAFSYLMPPLQDEYEYYWGFYKKSVQDIKANIDSRIREIVASTRALIIIGYSFPDDDKHIKELFKNCRFENVIIFDISEEVFRRIKEYFPRASVEFRKDGFADILNWNVGEGFKPSRSE